MSQARNEIWKRLRVETDVWVTLKLQESLAESVRRADVEDLLALARRGDDQLAALRVLAYLARIKAPLGSKGRINQVQRRVALAFTRAARGVWLRLVQRLARKEFPATQAGCVAFHAWRDLDRAHSDRFVLGPFDARGGERTEMQWLLVVEALRSARALSKLEALPRLPAKAEASRQSAMKGLRPIRAQDLAALLRKWRAERHGTALSRLIHEYLRAHGKERVRLTDVRRLLGKPSMADPIEDPHHLVYKAKGGYLAQFWADEDGLLESFTES